MRVNSAILWAALLLVGHAATAQAYIGPGAGLGALGALAGLVLAVLVSLGLVLSWPFRMLLRRIRKRNARNTDAQPTDAAQ